MSGWTDRKCQCRTRWDILCLSAPDQRVSFACCPVGRGTGDWGSPGPPPPAFRLPMPCTSLVCVRVCVCACACGERVRAEGVGGRGGAGGQGGGKGTANTRETESLSVCDVALDTSVTKIQDDAHTHVSPTSLMHTRMCYPSRSAGRRPGLHEGYKKKHDTHNTCDLACTAIDARHIQCAPRLRRRSAGRRPGLHERSAPKASSVMCLLPHRSRTCQNTTDI